MNNLDLKKISDELVGSFHEAGEVAKEISKRGVKISIKSDQTPVTDGDFAVDEILREKISKLTPQIAIISEETVDLKKKNKNKNFWLIDPIDGTRDYIKKREEYTLNAALIINLKPALGFVYAPAKNRLFFSYAMGKAYEIHNNENSKILKGAKKNTDEIIGLTNSDVTPEEVKNIYKRYNVTKTKRVSSSFKFCLLAAGEADIYAAKARAYEWDIAAGHTILQHAGGSVTDHSENEFLYGKQNYKNLPIIAKRNKDLSK